MALTVNPRPYKRVGSPFTFANLYKEYARFHTDANNALIHIMFIPVILGCFNGVAEHYPAINILKCDFNQSPPSFEFGQFNALPR